MFVDIAVCLKRVPSGDLLSWSLFLLTLTRCLGIKTLEEAYRNGFMK
jgi:hypothetical protein